MATLKESLTFDDVTLVPQFSSILPSEARINTCLGNNIDLDIPSIPACLKLHDNDVIVRIRTLKDKQN
mgnify:CR=1 FL=1